MGDGSSRQLATFFVPPYLFFPPYQIFRFPTISFSNRRIFLLFPPYLFLQVASRQNLKRAEKISRHPPSPSPSPSPNDNPLFISTMPKPWKPSSAVLLLLIMVITHHLHLYCVVLLVGEISVEISGHPTCKKRMNGLMRCCR